MAHQHRSAILKERVILILIALGGLIGVGLSTKYLSDVLLAVMFSAFICIAACAFLLWKFLRIDLPKDAPPGSLQRLSEKYFSILAVLSVIGIIGFCVEYEITDAVEIATITLYGIASIATLGMMAFPFLVLPIWYFLNRHEGDRE